MAGQAEKAFVTNFLNTLSTQSVTYSDDYQQPPQNSLKKIHVLPIEVPPPPERKHQASTSASTISIVFKSLKPPISFTLLVEPTDSISLIKSQLASQKSAPSTDAQRLLLKGKVLADSKLLKEYNVKDGDTVNLMVKPGFEWDPSKFSASPSLISSTAAISSTPIPSISLRRPYPEDHKPQPRKHQRIPSVVLSPSPSSEASSTEKPLDIMLTLDASNLPPSIPSETLSTYHNTVARPEFWQRLYYFLQSEFVGDGDALLAYEDFLRATKGTLTVSEIAKIRDQVGVIGMAGT